jgi:hypothetical protein
MPASIPADLSALVELPEKARAAFGEILGPCLEPKLREDTDRLIEAFCRKYDAVGNQLALALRGARFMIWEAAKSRATAGDLSRDLVTLVGEAHGATLTTILLPVYEAATERIRGEILRRALADHGTVVVGVDWRKDRIVSSPHGRAIDADIATLTLSCREGNDTRRVSVQLDKEMLVRLRTACDRLLG